MKRNLRDDEGVAIVMAIGIIVVVAILAITMVSYVVYTTKASGHDRQRASSIATAEAGVDASYVNLMGAGTALPCNTNTTPITAGVNDAPDTGSYSVKITYTYGDGTTGFCPSTDGKTPVSALIRSTGNVTHPVAGQSTPQRVMEAWVNLIPIKADGFNKAIFANGNLSLSNQTTVNGQNGSDADIYTNHDFNCANNETFHGSLYSQGTVTYSNSCSIDGDSWSKNGAVTTTGSNGVIGGKVLVSNGNVDFSAGHITVGGTVQASGTINWGSCTSSKCFPGATISPPPYQPFPIIRGDATTLAAWTAQGYTVLPSYTNCANVKDDIIAKATSITTPTVYQTPCAVNFAKDKTIALTNNLAIFAYGGFSSANQVTFDSNAAGTKRMLYWIVPYDAAPSTYPAQTCTSPGITTDQNFSVTTDVDMLLYSPCAISFANSSTHMGQIFGGSDVAINNKFTLDYYPLPVWGVDPNSEPTVSYNVDVNYKREVQ